MVGTRLIDMVLRDGVTRRRALPAGVKGASLFVAMGDAPPTDEKAWTFLGSITRSTCQLDLSAHLGETAGTAWICGFYFNGKAQAGNVSSAVAIDLPAQRPMPSVSSLHSTTWRAAA